MAPHEELDVYEIAYLSAGPPRVALVALLALCEDRRIGISTARHRVWADSREHRDPVEEAALEAIPKVGCMLGQVLQAVEKAPATAAVRGSLVKRGLMSRWRRKRPTAEGRRTRDRLLAAEPELRTEPSLRAVAAIGLAGVGDSRLLRIFRSPDPERVNLSRSKHRGWGGGGNSGIEGYARDGYIAHGGGGGGSSSSD